MLFITIFFIVFLRIISMFIAIIGFQVFLDCVEIRPDFPRPPNCDRILPSQVDCLNFEVP